jgi:hypothetical protein
MHFTVSWDISAKEPRWSEINGQMYAVFKALPHTHLMSTYYMVKATAEQYNAVHDALLKIAKTTTETVYFLMSPLLSAAGWRGWLPQTKWDEIKKITS